MAHHRGMNSVPDQKRRHSVLIAHHQPVLSQGLWSLGQQFGFQGNRCSIEQLEHVIRLTEVTNPQRLLVISSELYLGMVARSIKTRLAKVVVAARGKLSGLSQHFGRQLNVLISDESSAEAYRTALMSASNGQSYVAPEIKSAWQLLTSNDLHRWLTSRQLEIIRLVALGHSSKAIAEKLKLSRSTIENHRSRTMKRLGAKTSAELVLIATKNGWI